jgi:hypothetical protein
MVMNEIDQLIAALEGMVWQFAYPGVKSGKPVLGTGGLSALEEAFRALGWSDPYFLDEVETEATRCEVANCLEQNTNGSKK